MNDPRSAVNGDPRRRLPSVDRLVRETLAQQGNLPDWAVTEAARRVLAETLSVEIDIKPGSADNSINPSSRGVIPVAVLASEDFDALTVDPDSVRFGPAEAEKKHRHAHVEDVHADGDLDLLLHFRTQDTGVAPGDTEACLVGETYDGVPIQGCDSVRTVPPS